MEWKNLAQNIVVLTWLMVFLCQVTTAYPTPEDYEQNDPQALGMREILEELERQGGLTAPMVPRTYFYHTNPNHHMMRKSQRSSALRLRFGKRSAPTGFDNGLFGNEPAVLDSRPNYASNNNNNNNINGHQINSLKSGSDRVVDISRDNGLPHTGPALVGVGGSTDDQ